MPVIKGLEWTFDTVATRYEKLRPKYTDDLYKTLFNYISIDNSSNVVEVGIGGGQATLPILERGCTLTAVEYGENFSKLCEKKFENYKNFSVITEKFENTSFADFQYDLVYSASAFHWIPENIGYPKVYAMLKSGGAFARFANHPNREYSEEQAVQRAQIAKKYGFVDIKHAMFYRTRTFSAKEYVELLGTYSDHIAIKEKIRMEFFSKIEETINKYGGSFTIYDTIDLQLARKP